MENLEGTWVWEIKEATGTYEEFTFNADGTVDSYEDHCLFGESREGTYQVKGNEIKIDFEKAEDRLLRMTDGRLEDPGTGRVYRKLEKESHTESGP